MDTLKIFGITYSNVPGIKITDNNNNILTYIRPVGNVTITDNGTVDVAAYASAIIAIPSASGVSF